MNRFVILLAALALCGCEPDAYQAQVVAPAEGPRPERFRIELQGRFNAGFDNHRRDILILTDTTNGHKYLGITGVGITELWTEDTTTTAVQADGNVTTTTSTETVEE